MASEQPAPSMMEKVHPKVKRKYKTKKKKEKETIFLGTHHHRKGHGGQRSIHKQRTKLKGSYGGRNDSSLQNKEKEREGCG